MNKDQRLIMTVVILAVSVLLACVLGKKYVQDQADLYCIVSQKIIILVLCLFIILFGGCIIDLYMQTNKLKNEIKTNYNQVNLNIVKNNRKLNERRCGSRA